MPKEKNQPGATGMLLLSLLSRREMYGYEMIAACGSGPTTSLT